MNSPERASTASAITDEQIEAVARRYTTTVMIGGWSYVAITSYQKFARDILALAAPTTQPTGQAVEPSQPAPVAYVNSDELDNMLDDRTATIQSAPSGWRRTPLYTRPIAAVEPSQPAADEHDHDCSTHYHARAKCDCASRTPAPAAPAEGYVMQVAGHEHAGLLSCRGRISSAERY